MTDLYLSRLHFPVTALGPGRRIGIWFQGCTLHCPGCISVDTWKPGVGRTQVKAVMKAMTPWLDQADGLTVTGGEPFQQPEALRELLGSFRTSSAKDIFVFTGYEERELREPLAKMPGLIDVLMTGRYDRRTRQTLPLRGGDNQKMLMLTSLGRERFASFDEPESSSTPSLDLMIDGEGTFWFAGIPRHDDFDRLERLMKTRGHEIRTSAGTGI